MLTTFDPSVAENYSQVFSEPTSYVKITQNKLKFSEPAHAEPEVITVKKAQSNPIRKAVTQRMLRFSEPAHYAS